MKYLLSTIPKDQHQQLKLFDLQESQEKNEKLQNLNEFIKNLEDSQTDCSQMILSSDENLIFLGTQDGYLIKKRLDLKQSSYHKSAMKYGYYISQ